MQLTRHSDYALRVLIYLALHPDDLCHISEIARSFNVSRNHLVKVVHQLVTLGYVHSTRGRGGGIELSRPAADIRVGEIVRRTERNLEAINCRKPYCPILPSCRLKRALNDATAAFLHTLDAWTLADLVRERERLRDLVVK